MLPGNRATIASHQVSGFVHKGAPLTNSRFTHEIEVHTTVDTALPEMSIEGGSVLIFLVELAEISQITADSVGRNRRIFPAFPGKRSEERRVGKECRARSARTS